MMPQCKLCIFLLLIAIDAEKFTSEAKRQKVGGSKKAHEPTTLDASGINEISPAELEDDYWYKNAEAHLQKKLLETAEKSSPKRAKNLILFLGDGMSLPTLTATRAYIDDAAHFLSFEKFPFFGLAKTYCVDEEVTDSAASATAYLSGVKANSGTLGVNAQVPFKSCEAGQNAKFHTESIAKWAQDAGKWTGLVTNTRVTHASPAGVYAHTANRKWENDVEIIKSKCDYPEKITDIARQLIEWPVGRALRVIMGGGRSNMLDSHFYDEENKRGSRNDGRNLIEEWLNQKNHEKMRAKYVWNKQELFETDLSKIDYLMGLFSANHMPYQSDIMRESLKKATKPSLSEMTRAAIEVLQRSENGYFLFIEGGRIDLAHHGNKARYSLEETAEFSHAVQVARNITSLEDTLIVVTSDHSHTMTIAGYPDRKANILGLHAENAIDDLPYAILSYANGPSYGETYSNTSGRQNLWKKYFDKNEFDYMATVPLHTETHGNDDVGVFVIGPSARYFSGNYEQSYIPLLMAKAADIGPFKKLNP